MSPTSPTQREDIPLSAPLHSTLEDKHQLLTFSATLQPSDQPAWVSLLTAALTNATNGIVISANIEGRPIVYCNPAFERLTGYASNEIIGHNCRFLQGEGTDPDAIERMRAAFQSEIPIDLVLLNFKKDQTPFWNALNIGPIRNAEGTVTHFIGVQTDVTERVDTQRQLEQRAYTDVLTGLANRARFTRELERDVLNPELQGRFALGFIDLDGFKAINDGYGHDAGDELLKQVAQRLRTVVRNTDLVARLAGDEFVLLLRGVETVEALELVARRTLAAFQSDFVLQAVSVGMSASLGFVRHLPEEASAEMLARADQSMYHAKRGGKNAFSLGIPSHPAGQTGAQSVDGETTTPARQD